MVQSHFVSASLVVLLAGGCGLTEDSRCPSGVSWVWAGDAVVPIAVVDSTGRTTRLELHTNTSFDTAAPVDDLSVNLAGLAPTPSSDSPIEVGKYFASLVVRRQPE